MPTEPTNAELLESVNGLLEFASGLSMQIASLAGSVRSKASRKIVFWLTFSIGLVVILSVIMGLSLISQARQSAAFHAAEVAQCRLGNVERADDIKLWTGVLDTKSLYSDYLRLSNLVYVRDIPKNCIKIYG